MNPYAGPDIFVPMLIALAIGAGAAHIWAPRDDLRWRTAGTVAFQFAAIIVCNWTARTNPDVPHVFAALAFSGVARWATLTHVKDPQTARAAWVISLFVSAAIAASGANW